MDLATVLVLLLIAGMLAVAVVAVVGTIDALGHPYEVWERAGFRRDSWVWQALGSLFLPGALIYSGVYFARVRPRLVSAECDLARQRSAARGPAPAEHPTLASRDGRRALRMPASVAVAVGASIPIGALVGYLLAAWSAGFAAPSASTWIGWVAAAVLVAVINFVFGAVLTDDDLVVRGITRRRIDRADIVDITEHNVLGSRYVRVWTRAGQARQLRAPFAYLGLGRRRFDADVASLAQWWLAGTARTD